MKTTIKILAMIFLLASVNGHAQDANQIEASTDENCNSVTGSFTVPKYFIAFYFDFKVTPQWNSCNSFSDSDYNMVGIRQENKNTFLYQSYVYRNGDRKESSDLAGFILGPGKYELVISAHKGNSVTMTYYTGNEITITSR